MTEDGRSGRLRPVEQVIVSATRTVLANAFVQDPLMRWFFPDDDTRPHACAALFGLFAEQYLASGRVDLVRRTAPVAVAMWRWPGSGDDAPSEDLPTVPGLMSALMGARRAEQIGGAMRVICELRPPEPYAYLHLLGVDPAVQGQGLGGRCWSPDWRGTGAGLIACLETMNPPTSVLPVPRVRGAARGAAGRGGPTVWAMGTGELG